MGESQTPTSLSYQREIGAAILVTKYEARQNKKQLTVSVDTFKCGNIALNCYSNIVYCFNVFNVVLNKGGFFFLSSPLF